MFLSVVPASVPAMPSYLHETLVEMFRDRPAFAAEVLAGPLGIPVPHYEQARLSSTDLTEVIPTEYRADLVVTLTRDDAPVLAVVVEAQLRVDARKRRAWPAYVAILHARLGCPVMLLVVCPLAAVAAWCAAPIVVSEPGLVLTPVVLGPDSVPVLEDPVAARASPELAVLSAMAHGGRPEHTEVLDALLVALHAVDREHARLYADIVLAALPAAARTHLEALMTIIGYEYQSDFARRYMAEGKAQGLAAGLAVGKVSALLAILDARAVDVPRDVRERIEACTDLDQLDTWVRRAATAARVEELFA
jgi:hypothetical protein